MKIAAIPYELRRSFARARGDEELGRIDYTSPPRARRRRRRRPEEDIGNPSTIFPKAVTMPEFVSERNPNGTAYVQALIERIDSGKYPHELDERRKASDDEDELEVDAEADAVTMEDAS